MSIRKRKTNGQSPKDDMKKMDSVLTRKDKEARSALSFSKLVRGKKSVGEPHLRELLFLLSEADQKR